MLTEQERDHMIQIANEPEYADLPSNKIVPKLADKGIYIASESSFYRVLKAEKQLKHRQKLKPVKQVKKPRVLVATAPNQIYSWDITYLPTPVKGLFLYPILKYRIAVYQQAKLRNPNRWSGEIKNWDKVEEVYLNPENKKTENEQKERA